MPFLLLAGKVFLMTLSYSSSRLPWKRTAKPLGRPPLAPAPSPIYTGTSVCIPNLDHSLKSFEEHSSLWIFLIILSVVPVPMAAPGSSSIPRRHGHHHHARSHVAPSPLKEPGNCWNTCFQVCSGVFLNITSQN